jgi:hypothetical protein
VLFSLFQSDEVGQQESPGKHLHEDEDKSAAARAAEAKRAAVLNFMLRGLE